MRIKDPTPIEGETWLPIIGYEGLYEISDAGRVKSLHSRNPGRIIGTYTKDKYCQVSLTKNYGDEHNSVWRARMFKLHSLIGKHFVHNPDPETLTDLHHINGLKHDARADNLEWLTHADNIQIDYDSGRRSVPKGKDNWNYGRKASKQQKELMSQAKIGENHPKFKGWYVAYGKKYPSLRALEQDTGVYHRKFKKLSESNPKEFLFIPK